MTAAVKPTQTSGLMYCPSTPRTIPLILIPRVYSLPLSLVRADGREGLERSLCGCPPPPWRHWASRPDSGELLCSSYRLLHLTSFWLSGEKITLLHKAKTSGGMDDRGNARDNNSRRRNKRKQNKTIQPMQIVR